jgi:hypothetical protein
MTNIRKRIAINRLLDAQKQEQLLRKEVDRRGARLARQIEQAEKRRLKKTAATGSEERAASVKKSKRRRTSVWALQGGKPESSRRKF